MNVHISHNAIVIRAIFPSPRRSRILKNIICLVILDSRGARGGRKITRITIAMCEICTFIPGHAHCCCQCYHDYHLSGHSHSLAIVIPLPLVVLFRSAAAQKISEGDTKRRWDGSTSSWASRWGVLTLRTALTTSTSLWFWPPRSPFRLWPRSVLQIFWGYVRITMTSHENNTFNIITLTIIMATSRN